MDNKARIRRAFDRAAASYDGAAGLQRQVAQRLGEVLAKQLSGGVPGRVLDLGSGTGYGNKLLRQRWPDVDLLELDIAPAMLRLARDQRPTVPSIAQVCGDAEALPLAPACVALIWSSLVLQWAGDGKRAFAELARILKPGGLLAFATLGPGSLVELGQAFAGVDGYRHVNRFVAPEILQAGLAQAGFEALTMQREDIVVPYAEVREVLVELKAIGARRVLEQGVPGLMGKGRWQRALLNYENLRRDGVLPATYDVIYLTARKA